MATVFLPTVGAVGPAGPPGPATKGAPPRYWVWLDPNNGNKATAYDTHNGLPLVPTGTTDVALAAVVTALGGTNGTVALSGDTHTLLADPNLPANVCLQMPYGAVLSHSSYTLTIGGPVDAGPYQIFTGTGAVSLSTSVPEAWGDWWGAKGDGATDESTALNAAIARSFQPLYLAALTVLATAYLRERSLRRPLTGATAAMAAFSAALSSVVPSPFAPHQSPQTSGT